MQLINGFRLRATDFAGAIANVESATDVARVAFFYGMTRGLVESLRREHVRDAEHASLVDYLRRAALASVRGEVA